MVAIKLNDGESLEPVQRDCQLDGEIRPKPTKIIRIRTGLLRLALVLAMSMGASVFEISSAGAEATDRGSVSVLNANGTQALDSGGSATAFSLGVPKNAACPGDSMHAQYKVSSYVERAGTNLSEVSFKGMGYPLKGWDLITTSGEPYISNPTQVGTGGIIDIPSFSWSRYDHNLNQFPPGLDDVGLMCIDRLGNPTYYWNTQIRFVADTQDPGGFIWSVVKSSQPTAVTSTGGQIAGWVVAGVIVGGVLIGLAAWGWIRRRAGRGPRSTPSRPAGASS